MAKVKRQTYTLDMYLKKVQDLDIRADQDVQRLANQWNGSMASELIVSILNDEYIPSIILGTEKNSQAWIIDGCQRTTTLMMFRYGNFKISSNVEEFAVKYRAKMKDSEGNVKIDGNGDIVWEDREFDLRRKTYDKLPEELQKKFNEYQIECVIHENYTTEQISRLVRRFNFNKGMNLAQKTFTFVDKYARRIREILKREFFIEAPYSKAERKNGSLERIVMESVMCMFHLDDWKKSSTIGAFLNENASPEEFDILENLIGRLENIITDDLYSLFTSRDSFLLFSLFHKFTRLGLDDGKFADFLTAFKDGLCEKEIDGKIFYEKGRSLKERAVIMEKMYLLETLICEYFDIPNPESETEAILDFVKENINQDATPEDILEYEEVLEMLMHKPGGNTELMEQANKPSLIGIVAYSFMNDLDLDDWICDYCNRNKSYICDQKANYLRMKADLENYMKLENAA